MSVKQINCIKDICISQQYPSNAYNQADRLAFGSGSSDASDKYYALLDFDTHGLIPTDTISVAILTLIKIPGAIGWQADFQARALQITSAWSESTNYITRPTTTTTDASPAGNVGYGHTDGFGLDVTEIVKNWAAGETQYGVLIEKTTAGAGLLKCIADRTSMYRAYITIGYEHTPSPTSPIPTAPGTITTESKMFMWSPGTDPVFSSEQLYYELQFSSDNGGNWGGTLTSLQGSPQYDINIRDYLGVLYGQYYLNNQMKYRVRTKTPLHNGLNYYSSDWDHAPQMAFVIDYRIMPSVPSSLTVSKSNPYEGETIQCTVGRPSTYNAYKSDGGAMELTYNVILGENALLISGAANVSATSLLMDAYVGLFTSGPADLSTLVKAGCVDAQGQSSPYTNAAGFTVRRYRAPVVDISSIDRSTTGAVVHISVSDTGYGGSQSNGQIQKIQYKLGSGAWTDAILGSWNGLTNTFTLSGLAANTRYSLQIRVINNAPAGTSLSAQTSAVYSGTIMEYSPALFAYRNTATGKTGIAVESAVIGEDYSAAADPGCLKVQHSITAENVYTGNLAPSRSYEYSGIAPNGTVTVPIDEYNCGMIEILWYGGVNASVHYQYHSWSVGKFLNKIGVTQGDTNASATVPVLNANNSLTVKNSHPTLTLTIVVRVSSIW